jgi:recombination protein RecR
MKDRVEELSHLFEKFPGIGTRQAKRFVYHLLASSPYDRAKLSELIARIGEDVHQCEDCMRFWSGQGLVCGYCSDASRENTTLMIVEKDQDLLSIERSGGYRGRYFVLGGTLTLSGKGAIREKQLIDHIEKKIGGESNTLSEIILALSATTEGEHTADHIRIRLQPLRTHIKLYTLGRGLSTGSELEYADSITISGALKNRQET